MFGLGFGEIAIILVVALIVLGPSKLPELARGLGKGLREFRKATEDFKSTMEEEIHRPDPPRQPRIQHDEPAQIVAPAPQAMPAPQQVAAASNLAQQPAQPVSTAEQPAGVVPSTPSSAQPDKV